MMWIVRWTSAGFPLFLSMMLAAAPAAAQKANGAMEADRAPIPEDTARLSSRFVDLGDCGVIGYRVVSDSAAVKDLLRYPQCRRADFGDVRGRTLVGLRLWGDCHSSFQVDAWRSEKLRQYRVRVTTYSGGCHSMTGDYHWLALPTLPPGWRVALSERYEPGGHDGAGEPPLRARVLLPQPGGSGAEARR